MDSPAIIFILIFLIKLSETYSAPLEAVSLVVSLPVLLLLYASASSQALRLAASSFDHSRHCW